MKRAVSGDAGAASDVAPPVAFAVFARQATRRYVTPPLILSLAVAAALAASFLSLATRLDGETAAALRPWVERFLGNGFSRLIALTFLSAALYGALQLLGIAVDRRRLRRLGLPDGAARASWLAALAGRPLRPYTGNPATRPDEPPGDPHAAADRFSLQRQGYAEAGLLPLRFGVWVLPLLGFIGTVVGIARSITGLETVIAPATGGQSAEGLLAVLGGLQFAFDTTLLGLLAVIPVMLLQMVLGGRESQVTEEGRHHVLALLTAADALPSAGPDDTPAPPAGAREA